MSRRSHSPHHSRQPSAISTSNSSVIRSSSTSHSPSPSASASPVSPTHEGLSRRHSWNRPREADADRGLSVSDAHAVIEGQHTGLGISSLGSSVGRHPPDEYDIGVSRQYSHETIYPPAPAALDPITASLPRPYFSQYPATSQASLESAHSDGETPPETDGERLTFAPRAGSAHRRVPSRAYDEQGNPRAASMGARVAGAVSRNSTFRHVSRSLRKASVRVVNIMGTEETRGRVKIDDEGDDGKDMDEVDEPEGLVQEPEGMGGPTRPDPMPPEGRLRGRTLGVFGPSSRTRKAMDALLRYP